MITYLLIDIIIQLCIIHCVHFYDKKCSLYLKKHIIYVFFRYNKCIIYVIAIYLCILANYKRKT